MAGKKFDFVGEFGWKEGWEVDFSKIKVLENSASFTNMVLESLLNIFGRDKDQVFDVLVRAFPLPPETDLVKLKKTFSGRINYYYALKKKIMKTQAEKEQFFDSESSLGELFSKTDNLCRESLSPAAVPCSSSRKETPLKEQIQLLKQEAGIKGGTAFSLSKESCCMERCHRQKQKNCHSTFSCRRGEILYIL